MVDLSFLSFLPFIGHRFKKSAYIEYIKSDLTSYEKLPTLSTDKQYQCKCCLSFCSTNSIVTCNKSTEDDPHTFCKECISKYITHGINSYEIKLSCMCAASPENCKGTFTFKLISECVDKETYDKFEESFEIKEIKKFCGSLKNYQICPHCHKCGIIANKNILQCKKNNCKKKWCSKCRKSDHSGYTCNKIHDPQNIDAIRTIVEETINHALIHKCPKCRSTYVKEEGLGCNHMTCTTCKTRSCYLCGLEMCNCPQYNRNKNSNMKDDGNWLYNRKKIINSCRELLMENDKDVQIVMIKELERHGVYINIEDL